MKISFCSDSIDVDIYLKQHKNYTEIFVFGFVNYVPVGDSFNLKMSPRRVKKRIFQYIYQHSCNDFLTKALLGKF